MTKTLTCFLVIKCLFFWLKLSNRSTLHLEVQNWDICRHFVFENRTEDVFIAPKEMTFSLALPYPTLLLLLFFFSPIKDITFQIFSDGRYSSAALPLVRPLSLPVVTKHWYFNIFRSKFFFYCSIETLWWIHIMWLDLNSTWSESFRNVMVRVVGLCTDEPGLMSECRMYFLS